MEVRYKLNRSLSNNSVTRECFVTFIVLPASGLFCHFQIHREGLFRYQPGPSLPGHKPAFNAALEINQLFFWFFFFHCGNPEQNLDTIFPSRTTQGNRHMQELEK